MIGQFIWKMAWVAVCCLGLSLEIMAQSPLDSLYHLNEVVITAKPFKEVIPAQRLNGVQLERLNTHNVKPMHCAIFSGVQIKDYGGMEG
ncbi:MAG: hypothetical protein ACLVL2_11990 [Bacteroides cellulosilyticus]